MTFFGKKRNIYLDHAATTPVSSGVLRAMRPFWQNVFGNPGSIHSEGVVAQKALKSARGDVAQFFACQRDEVVFTASGTAANNLAIRGVFEALSKKGHAYSDMHVITTPIEHSSVREVFEEFATRGVEVTYIPVHENGLIDQNAFEQAITDNTVLVSVGYVNGEIGVVQSIGKLAKILRKKNTQALFHTDASQAPEYLPVRVHTLGVDLCTIDAQKMYGPKGVGALFVKQGVELAPLLLGGGQEKGLVAGTEALPLIVGLATAAKDAEARREKEGARMRSLQTYAFDLIKKELPNAVINGDTEKRIPNNIHMSLPGIDTEFLVIQLDQKGFSVATKSACDSSVPNSRVVAALDGSDTRRAQATLRISCGRATRKRHIKKLVRTIQKLCI